MQGLRCHILYILTGNCNCSDTAGIGVSIGVSILLINTIIKLFIIVGGLAIYKVVMIVWHKRAQTANSAEDQQRSSACLTERQGGPRGKGRAIQIELEQNQAYGSSA